MSEALPPIDRDEAMLSRLAELDLALAEKVHAQAMAATEPDEINGLGRTYQRVARSLRQTLAMKARLRRERAERAAAPRAERRADPRVQAHKAQVRAALRAHLWTEYEHEAAEQILDEADWFLDLEAEEDGFLADPVAAIVARLCRDAEIDPPKRAPPEPAPAPGPARQGSG